MFPHGSEWRRWDLHIHTPTTLLNNQYRHAAHGTPDWESFVDRLEASPLAVIGVTDYFTIEGYKTLREFKRAGRLQNITLLPNIEFRLNKFVGISRGGGASQDKRLTLHVIFSDTLAPDDIEQHFLHDLHFVYEGNPQSPDESRKLKIANLESMGERLRGEHPSFQSLPALQVGAQTAVVDDQEIVKLLANDNRFAGKYVLILADESLSDISWDGQGHVVRKTLLQKSDMVFTSNSKAIQWCLGRTPYVGGESAFVKEFKSLKPCIHGSDAHTLNSVGTPCAKRGQTGHSCTSPFSECDLRYCWIKADPTFEGLLQLVYEPEARVRIQPLDPTPIKSQYTITSVAIPETRINDELVLENTSLPLSEGLVAVIGVRGSGKTALLDLVAHCFQDRTRSEDPNSFVQRIIADAPTLRATLTLKDGTKFTKELNDGRLYESSAPVYIAQGELEGRISDRAQLASHIRDLVFDSPVLKDTKLAFDFSEANGALDMLAESVLVAGNRMADLEAQTSQVALEKIQLGRSKLEADLTDVNARLDALAKHLTPGELETAKTLQERVRTLQDRREQLIDVKESLMRLRKDLDESLPRINRQILEIAAFLRDLEIDNDMPELSYQGERTIHDLQGRVDSILLGVIADLDREAGELRTRDARLKDHADALRRQGEIDAALKANRSSEDSLNGAKARLEAIRSSRLSDFQSLLVGFLDQQDRYRTVIETFRGDMAAVLSDLEFVPEMDFDTDRLLDSAETVLDNRQVSVRPGASIPSVFADLLVAYADLKNGDRAAVARVLDVLTTLDGSLRDKVKRSAVLSRRELYRLLWTNYLRLTPIIKYKNVPLNRLSLGQKATVLVKMYLARGSNPIIIDSHDEHMDNEFIVDELVHAIRAAKGRRQVLLASNNGNVVVNSDAEQVIIATHTEGRISYESGSLEDPGIRQRALKILEGGELAFRRRQEKYRVS